MQRGISRPAPVEPEEGGGAAKRQKQRRDGGVAAKPGNGAPKDQPNHSPIPAASQPHADALQQAGSIAQAAAHEDTSARDKGVDDVHPWMAPAFSESARAQMAADEAAAEALQKCAS